MNPKIDALIEQYFHHRDRLYYLAQQAQLAPHSERAPINTEIKRVEDAFAQAIAGAMAALSRNDRLDLVWVTEEDARQISSARILSRVTAQHALARMLPNPSDLEVACTDRLRRVLLRR